MPRIKSDIAGEPAGDGPKIFSLTRSHLGRPRQIRVCLFSWIGLIDLQKRGVAFRSLTEQMDTTTPHGEFLFSVFGALAQYERALTRERILAGLEAAKKRGTTGGRPKAITDETLNAIVEALNAGASKAAICRTFGVKRSTLYDALKRKAKEL